MWLKKGSFGLPGLQTVTHHSVSLSVVGGSLLVKSIVSFSNLF